MNRTNRALFEQLGKLLALFSMTLLLCSVITTSAWAQSKPDPTAKEAITHAWTYYWAGVLDGGDLIAFDRGLDWARRADASIAKLDAGDPERERLSSQVEAVKKTITKQRAVAEVTLRGHFPLTALFKKSLFFNSGALGNYELVDDPDDVAVTKLTGDLRDGVLTKWGALPQTDVTVISNLPDQALDDKVLMLLSTTPKINLRPFSDVAKTLPDELTQKLQGGEIEAHGEEARQIFGADRLIFITINRVDIVDDVYAVELHSHVFDGKRSTNFSILGVTHDRRGQQTTLWLVVALCFLLGLGLTQWLTAEKLTWSDVIILGGTAFFAGLMLPNAVIGLIDGLEPPLDELMMLSFWWPVFAGLTILVGTPVGYTTLLRRFGASIPLLKRAIEVGPQVAVAVGAGVAAFMARAPIVYDPELGWVNALLMLGCCIGAARLVAQIRAKMTIEPTYMFLAAVALAAAGPAYFADSLPGIATCSFLVVLATTRAAAARRALEEEAGPPPEILEELDDESLAHLLEKARHPEFQAFEPYEHASKLAFSRDREERKHARWLFIQGQRGSGKTSTSEAVLESVDFPRVILRGACSPPNAAEDDGSDGKPFEVFIRAFHAIGMLGLEEPEEDIFSSLEGRVIGAIPIVAMLLPSDDEEGGGVVSDRGELYARVVRELIKQTRRGQRRVFLVLDDIQWLDSASQELVLHLLGVFSPGAEHPVTIMLCGRNLPEMLTESPAARRVLVDTAHVCVELDRPQRLHMLEKSIGFDPASAEMLDTAVTAREGKSNLAWLLLLVEAIARSGQVFYDEQDGEYQLTVEDASELPIPENFRKMVGQAYDNLSRERQAILRAAACLGHSFGLEVIARVTGMDRIHVIGLLEEIGEETGLIEDDLSADDVFKFVSTQRFQALRDHLGIRDVHPRDRQSQLLRDLHYKIARVLEELLDEHRADVSDVATHYWLAGRRDLLKALLYCQKAYRAARDLFGFDAAEFQLRRAIACAEILSQGNYPDHVRHDAAEQLIDLDLALRTLPFDKAHILGVNDLRQTQADLAEALFERDASDGSVDVPLELLIAMTRACYDARRFDKARELAEALVDIGRPGPRKKNERQLSENDAEIRDMAYIEGLHFVGLSIAFAQAEERLEWIERAYEEAEKLDMSDEPRRALRARVVNSLGEQLAQLATYDFERAKTCFNQSISIKRELKPQDKPGLARAYGGLGRLYLFAAKKDEHQRGALLKKASTYFQEDIDLCQDYGDVAGECQMHSHMGECDLLLERYEEAVTSYKRSLELAQNPISSGFALIGLLKATDALSDRDAATTHARAACELALNNSLPPFLSPMLLGAIKLESVRADEITEFDDARQALGDEPPADRAGTEEE